MSETNSFTCISCLETDNVHNIFDTFVCEGVEEIYSDMLKSCFDVSLPENSMMNYMCVKCIQILRQAYYFKQEVVKNIETLESAANTEVEYLNLEDIELRDDYSQSLDPETGCMIYTIQTICGEKINEDHDPLSNNESHADTRETSVLVDVDGFQCCHCDKKFPSKIAISRHIKTHLDGPFPCEICGQEFTKLNSRNSHVWRVHRTAAPYVCSHCGRRFATFHRRLAHLNETHGQRDEYPCPHCSNVYSYAGARSKHVRETHLREQRHGCPRCRMAFFKRRELLSHLASIHDIGEKKHACTLCDKSFYKNSTLNTHMKTHKNQIQRGMPHQPPSVSPLCTTEGAHQNLPDEIYGKVAVRT